MTGSKKKLNAPWLVAVWPGMGQVALTAGYYLMSHLRMHEGASIPADDLFDIEHVDVKDGIVRPGRLPRNRIFLWKDPKGKRDVAIFIGEAQPPSGNRTFCARLLDAAKELGVSEVVTFAAMATDMHPRDGSRVCGVATHADGLEELRRRNVEVMEDGRITGLNGVFLGEAVRRGLKGVGLLGEMPGIAPQVPFPKASYAVLDIFARMAGIEIDLGELRSYGEVMENQLSEAIDKMQEALAKRQQAGSEGVPEGLGVEGRGPTEEDRKRIEKLFQEAERDRSRTFELKRELDRLDVFKEYEDRFLDLFKPKE